MGGTAYTQLIPIQELTPGQVGKIRNDAISYVVALASKELNLSPDKMVVRDIRPYGDLAMYDADGAVATQEDWLWVTATSGIGWKDASALNTMADNRFIAIFGVRDARFTVGVSGDPSAAGGASMNVKLSLVTQVKITVGGADKVIWDFQSTESYPTGAVAFAPTAVIIPQNASYQFQWYKPLANQGDVYVQLIGVTVEPRGKLISP